MAFAILGITASTITGILVSTYLQQASAQINQTGTNRSSSSSLPSQNWTGSVQIFPRLSQIVQSKANTTLGTATSNAEKAVGSNSHATSAHLGIVNGFLVYTVHVIDANNNIHRVIVDAGNGKVLSIQQFSFGNPLLRPDVIGPEGKGEMFSHSRGTFMQPGFLNHFGHRMW